MQSSQDNWYKYCSIVIDKLTSITTLENLKRYFKSSHTIFHEISCLMCVFGRIHHPGH